MSSCWATACPNAKLTLLVLSQLVSLIDLAWCFGGSISLGCMNLWNGCYCRSVFVHPKHASYLWPFTFANHFDRINAHDSNPILSCCVVQFLYLENYEGQKSEGICFIWRMMSSPFIGPLPAVFDGSPILAVFFPLFCYTCYCQWSLPSAPHGNSAWCQLCGKLRKERDGPWPQ